MWSDGQGGLGGPGGSGDAGDAGGPVDPWAVIHVRRHLGDQICWGE